MFQPSDKQDVGTNHPTTTATTEICVLSPQCLENAVVVGWVVPTFCFQSPATTYQSDRLASENRCLLRNIMARMGAIHRAYMRFSNKVSEESCCQSYRKGHTSGMFQPSYKQDVGYSDDRDLRIIATSTSKTWATATAEIRMLSPLRQGKTWARTIPRIRGGRDLLIIAAPTRQDVGTNHPTTTVTAEIRRDRRSDKQDVGTNHPTTTATDEIRVRSPLLQARRGHEPSHYKSLVSCLVRVHASSNAPGEFLILA